MACRTGRKLATAHLNAYQESNPVALLWHEIISGSPFSAPRCYPAITTDAGFKMKTTDRTKTETVRIGANLWPQMLLFLLFSLLPASAYASCMDAPRPDVEWVRCLLNERTFTGISIPNAVVRDSSFNRAILDNADMEGVDARRAKFVSASMKGVILRDANLQYADMTKVVLDNADLTGADMRSARLFQASLRSANLTGALLDNADFYRTDLSGATWVDGKTICGEGSLGICK